MTARLRTPAFVLLSGCLVLFALVASDVEVKGLLARLDPHIAEWAFVHVRPWDGVLQAVTHLGDAAFLAVVTVAAAAWLLRARRKADAVFLVAASATTALVTVVLKDAFSRARPPYVDPASGPHSFSFPSGHASGAFAVYVLAALLLSERLSPKARAAAVSVALSTAAVVATTRVLMPVHYTTDVVAGAAVGLAVVACALVARVPSARRR
jgi:undecaprenyl-diphosphatase